ncbi:ubiquitin carboxyl-terminal hydrolase family protein [Podospora aff. communis PSN243]|uniref:Ubiquitin carboxyl-terminal hydrolase family protein n=1 Tax=Podospora aff. communis PSN243 TaxID=3040156 RepID=A0AAV9H201_9PEZI|nr:ubiquitin carboxyl-terminal hydrolase family protein [Podospora aff. communis PSN243]
MPSPPLPNPRALLISLLDAITNIPLNPIPPPTTSSKPIKTEDDSKNNKKSIAPAANALTRVPASHRHLLITLHVLFPSTLLPALDLLDRGLVVRLTLDATLTKGELPKSELTKPEKEENKPNLEPSGLNTEEEKPPSFYLVHSAQNSGGNSNRRRHRGEAGTGKAYIVRLGAWNCTCAAFAFAGFPVGGGGDGEEVVEVGEGMDVDVEPGEVEEEERLSFGGFTVDDGTEEGPPVCKHILACLLGERWGEALGDHVVERRVGREEMAGVVADI